MLSKITTRSLKSTT